MARGDARHPHGGVGTHCTRGGGRRRVSGRGRVRGPALARARAARCFERLALRVPSALGRTGAGPRARGRPGCAVDHRGERPGDDASRRHDGGGPRGRAVVGERSSPDHDRWRRRGARGGRRGVIVVATLRRRGAQARARAARHRVDRDRRPLDLRGVDRAEDDRDARLRRLAAARACAERRRLHRIHDRARAQRRKALGAARVGDRVGAPRPQQRSARVPRAGRRTDPRPGGDRRSHGDRRRSHAHRARRCAALDRRARRSDVPRGGYRRDELRVRTNAHIAARTGTGCRLRRG